MEKEIVLIFEDNEKNINLEKETEEQTIALKSELNGSGTTNYEYLKNLPKINGEELRGNKTSLDLGLQDEMEEISNLEIDKIFKGGTII